MPLYRWNPDNLEPVTATTFESEQILEEKLQDLLRDRPHVIEQGLFVVRDEYSNWEGSYRSIDLLALDAAGSLVVIELKRTQTGDYSELQAIRYAAMVSNMTLDQIVDAHRIYLDKWGIQENARTRVLNHLGVSDDPEAEIDTERPRIILVSAGFSTELTTSVLWLRDGGMDISCVKLQLYKSNNELLMDASQVIPLPEASDYLVRVREKEEVEKRQRRASQVERIQGGEAFIDAIELVREEFKPMLRQLHGWAVSLESEGLAILETRQGSVNTTLRASLPTANVCFAIIWQGNGVGSCQINRNPISSRAPKANERIVQILGEEDYSGFASAMPPHGLLDALTEAYREANGRPLTAPPPGTAPDSPLPAE